MLKLLALEMISVSCHIQCLYAIKMVIWRLVINKLYPLYVVSLLMLIPISGLAQSVISQDWIQVKYILFGWYLKDILLVQSWIPVDYYCLNGAAWYLSTLVFLLLCLNPILYFYKRGGGKTTEI